MQLRECVNGGSVSGLLRLCPLVAEELRTSEHYIGNNGCLNKKGQSIKLTLMTPIAEQLEMLEGR
jgi:hypothetical protein